MLSFTKTVRAKFLLTLPLESSKKFFKKRLKKVWTEFLGVCIFAPALGMREKRGVMDGEMS